MVQGYWKHLQDQEAWAHVHPGVNCMPIGLHGDDGRYNRLNDKVIPITLNFPLARDVSRILAFSITCVGICLA